MYPNHRFVMDAWGRWKLVPVPPERQLRLFFDHQDDVDAVCYGLRLLRETIPAIHDRVFRELLEMKAGSYRVCGSRYAIACTNVSDDERCVYFVQRPSEMDPVEVAVTIGHESLHHETTDDGVHFRVEHSCKNCRDARERAKDAIYVWEERVRPHLRATHQRLQAPPVYAYGSYVLADYSDYYDLWR